MSYSQSNVDLSTLDLNLSGEGISSSVIGSINSYLIGLGDTTGLSSTKLISLELGEPPFAAVKVLNVTPAGTYSIATATGNQLIVLRDDGSANVTITGSTNVMVATGGGSNTVTLNDTGNDIVITGAGGNTITGGQGPTPFVAALVLTR